MTHLDKHKSTLGTLMIVFGILKIALYIVGLQILSLGLAFVTDEAEIQFAAYLLKYIIGVAVLLYAIPAIIAGIGLRQGKSWGLILAFVIGILSLPVFPLGTALGVYACIVYLMDHSETYNQKKSTEEPVESL